MQKEITGVESARKTSNQLKRLWLNNKDGKKELRMGSAQILKTKQVNNQSIFHLGMAINVFPIFQEVCRRLGYLTKVQPEVSKNTLIERVAQTFLTPSSGNRTGSRVIQTLENWGFIEINNSAIRLQDVLINDQETSVWFIEALVLSNSKTKVLINAGDSIPEKLEIQILDIRNFIQ
ncbi:MAG: hypothetical protein GYA45_02105 [Pelolinea sp.]|nr:hypothetical protein [Pelolinea sp.]